MKNKFVIVVVVVFWATVIYAQEIDSIVIRYVDMNFDNCRAIPCSEFCVSVFKDANRAVITDQIKIKEFMGALKQLSYDTISNYAVDTKSKIYIYRKNSKFTTIICLGFSSLQIGDESFVYNDEFLRVLGRYMNREYLPNHKIYVEKAAKVPSRKRKTISKYSHRH